MNRWGGRESGTTGEGLLGCHCAGLMIGGRSPGPDVPWFVLPSSFAPYSPPGSPSSPYSAGSTLQGADNPPPGSPIFPFHANIQRFWASVAPILANPTYVVVVPSTVPIDPLTGGPRMTTSVAASFPGLIATGAAANYTWQQWATSVQDTFRKYTNVNTANISATYGGAVFSTTVGPMTGYGRSEGAAIFGLPPFSFIWDVTLGGPTGNGINEIILTDQSLAGIGLTSMLVDPANGNILECDVIFDVGVTTASPLNAVGARGLFQASGTNTTVPEEWTALDHEIGHFWGLDHTNLHSGIQSVGGTLPIANYGPVPANPTNISRALFPTGVPPVAGPPVFPGMVGFITHLGIGANRVVLNLHNDDAVSLSKIYPVPMPRRGIAKVPLINVSASIRGRVTSTSTAAGVFGRNVWVVPDVNLDVAGVGYPNSGVISSTARVVDDPLTTTPDPNVPGTNYYRDDLAANAPFFSTNQSRLGAGGTGDFSIDGIPTSIVSNAGSPNPPEFDIVFEDAGRLGAGFGNQAEWFGAPSIYTGNPFGAPTTIQTAVTFLSNMTFIPRSGASSLSLVQGTVIHIAPTESNDFLNLGAPAAMPQTIQPPPCRCTAPNTRSSSAFARLHHSTIRSFWFEYLDDQRQKRRTDVRL